MRKEFKFKKEKILFGLIFSTLLLLVCITFILNTEIYIRNEFTSARKIKVIGIVGSIYSSSLLYSFGKLFSKKYSIRITEEFLIDNSKHEALGEIKWKDIYKIERLKKNSIKLTINEAVIKAKKSSLLKRFLTFMHNPDYKKSIIISSAIIDCSTEELFQTIYGVYTKMK